MKRLLVGAALFAAACAVACTSATVSPPLSAGRGVERTFSGVYLSSGVQTRPHIVIGVVQMTQTGYKWMHEIQLVDDARPESLLYRIGHYAQSLGAHGVQHLRVVDLDPQTPADKATRKVDSVIRMEKNLREKNYAALAGEGTKTTWEIRGELIQFVDRPGGL
jgi:hypothetical protein